VRNRCVAEDSHAALTLGLIAVAETQQLQDQKSIRETWEHFCS
jgi:hypothetical protein